VLGALTIPLVEELLPDVLDSVVLLEVEFVPIPLLVDMFCPLVDPPTVPLEDVCMVPDVLSEVLCPVFPDAEELVNPITTVVSEEEDVA